MHGHTILMLAGVGVVAAFVPIVLVVRWLEAHGRIRDADGPVAFRSYGAVIAGAFSAGSAAIHLSVIGDHAAGSGGDPFLFLCSVGVATTHLTTMDASVAGFLPVGVATLVVAPVQAAWVVPRLWRRVRISMVGLIVAIGSLLLGLSQIVLTPAALPLTPASHVVAEVSGAALIGEGVVLIGVALLVIGRPRRIHARLEARPADACVAIGLALAAAMIFTIVAIGVDHVVH